MPSSNDIRNIQFSAAKNGYSRDEVDVFLDKVEEDYVKFESESARLRAAVANLTKELEEAKNAQNSIQTVLLKAQTLADDIVAKAKAEAEEILEGVKAKTDLAETKAKDAILDIEKQANENRRIAEAEIEKMKADALETSEAMITSAKDSVARQQIQFEAIKTEVLNFKEQIKDIYKKHIELLAEIPEEISDNPIEAASAVEQILAEARAAAAAKNAAELTEKAVINQEEPQSAEAGPEIIAKDIPAEESDEDIKTEDTITEEPEEAEEGFKVTIPDEYVITPDDEYEDDDEDDDEEEKRGFSSSKFFRRR